MEKSFCCLILFFMISVCTNIMYCQASNTGKFHYNLKESKFIAPSKFQLQYDGMPLALCAKTSAVVSVSNGHITVDFFQFLNDACSPAKMGFVPATPIKGHTVEIVDNRDKLGDATNVLKLPFGAWNFGINSISFRVRKPTQIPGGFETYTVTGAFSLAVSGGKTWGYGKITTRGINNYSLTLSAFGGPSSASGSGLPQSQVNLVASYGGAVVLARNGLGVIISYGWDTSMGDHSKEWAYQNKGWFGIGLSASLLK